ncbi:MAG: PAS domain S-box protein [Candidatus Dadabacteria bacterium]|nr:PAS domain S-box protein [Candidatus Dadabacteria bacterium]
MKDKEGFVLEARIAEKDYLFTHRRDFEADLVFIFGSEITKQKEAEQMVRLLLNSTGEGIYAVDLEGNCTFANPACVRLLGFESDADLLGRHMHNLVHHTRPNGEPYPVEQCRIYKAFRNNEGTHVDDEVMFCANGKPFKAEYWSYPIERDGNLEGCVVTFVDIEQRRRVEEELRQSEKMSALGKLSAGLAHELNNPAAAAGRAASQLIEGFEELQSSTIELARSGIDPDLWDILIKYYKEFLTRTSEHQDLSPLEASDLENELLDWFESNGIEDGWDIAPILVKIGISKNDLEEISKALHGAPLDKVLIWLCKSLDTRELAGTVVNSTQRMSELVGVVKSYSHMDRAKEQYVDVHRGLEDTLIILGHKLKRGIEVRRDYDRDLPRVLTGGSELNQVWTNIIDNAISAMGEKGTLSIKTYRDNNRATVEIADTGPGIPKEIQSKVFDPFFTTKEVGEGTGLGLDVVRRIITARCGGEVDFKSGSDGTTFYIRLPIE